MPFLKTLSGGGGSCKQVDDYLSFGHRSTEDHEERIENTLPEISPPRAPWRSATLQDCPTPRTDGIR